ncbi:MAG: hypothetical protein LH702_05845 [Phormidesmis sp. CAN_BIN44]|nr:hypothetical protein [Phormidesmis sp. CAN_BIN44]
MSQPHLLTKPVQSRFIYSLLCLMLLVVCAGCLQAQSSRTELTMQAEPAGQPGVYIITGKTNLPNQTRITVQAVRTLRPVDRASRLTNQEQTHTILARQPVEVTDGKWQTTLNLLRADSGRSLETWQTHNSQLGLNLAPGNQVTFQAVTDPANRSLDVEQQPRTTAQGESLIIHFTTDGKSYLQAEQALSIAPPSLQAAKPSTAMNPKLGTPVIVMVPTISKQIRELSVSKSQLNAPLSASEFLH